MHVLLVIGFVVGGTFMLPDNLGKSTMKPKSLLSGNFAAGLVYVSFAYTGWNAATYVAGEVKKPHRTVPLSLIVGTLLVTFLYMGLNAVFLLSVPLDELSGVTEVGHVAAAALFGESAARVMSAIIALGLISTVGALVMTGPRVYEAVGEDFHVLRKLAVRKSPAHGPTSAIYGQGCIAVLLVLSTSFDALLTYIGFTLSVFAALTAAAVIVLRVRSPDLPRPYRVWLYPLPPIIFISLNLWMIYHVVSLQPVITLAGVGTVLVGGVFFVLMRRRGPANPTQTASGSVPIPLTRPQKGDASSDELP